MKKTLSIMLLSALLLCSCTEPSADNSSQDISSEIVSQESSEASSNAEISSADVSSEGEETPSYVYARRGEESLFVEDAKEIIESFKVKDDTFEAEAKRKGANIHSVSNSLIQVYEYTLDEYAETGKINPRATNRYYYCDDYVITEHEDSVSISNQELIPFKDITDKLREMKIDAEAMAVTLVEIANLGRCYYVDDGQTELLVPAQDIEDSYTFDNAAMLLFYDTSGGKPYNCIILNDTTQLRAKGVAADEEEYAQMIREMIEKDGPASAFTGGKDWYDREILSKYFVKSCNLPENMDYSKLIKPKNMQYFGQSNGWRVYHATYEGQACDTAVIEKDLGGYKFYSSGIYYPSEVSIYLIRRKEVLTLEQAYEKGKIDVKEVYEFTPEAYKR